MRTYFETDIISYLVRARKKEGYKQKIELIERLIQEGKIEPVTSVIAEDEIEEAKKGDIQSILNKLEKVQSSIAVFPIKLNRNKFGDDYTHSLHDEYLKNLPAGDHAKEREDSLHYVNILDRRNRIELAILGDRQLIRILKKEHPEVKIVKFHDSSFGEKLLNCFKKRKKSVEP